MVKKTFSYYIITMENEGMSSNQRFTTYGVKEPKTTQRQWKKGVV